jgi:hypothetical protein
MMAAVATFTHVGDQDGITGPQALPAQAASASFLVAVLLHGSIPLRHWPLEERMLRHGPLRCFRSASSGFGMQAQSESGHHPEDVSKSRLRSPDRALYRLSRESPASRAL